MYGMLFLAVSNQFCFQCTYVPIVIVIIQYLMNECVEANDVNVTKKNMEP